LDYKQNFEMMKNYNSRFYQILICTLGIIQLIGCEKFVQVDLKAGELSDQVVFRDSTNAEAAVIGLYLYMSSSSINSVLAGGVTLLTGLSGDELIPINTTDVYREFYENDLSIDNRACLEAWQQAYKQIYMANACLEGLEKVTVISESKRTQLLGEVYQIRAANYFYMVQLFGDVPLVLTTDYRINQNLPKSPMDKIYEQIISDLQLSKEYLANSYYSPLRASYYSAMGLLAKIYLTLGRYQEAEIEATNLISSGRFSLEGNLQDVFMAGSNETIWSWVVNDNNTSSRTREGFTFIPTSNTVLPAFGLSPQVLMLFEDSDQRKSEWINQNLVAGEYYHFPYKYKVGRVQSGSRMEHYIILRLAEQYLIRAESRIKLGDIEAGVDDLNMIRLRAGLDALVAESDISRILELLIQERRRELFCEWGHRWLDLKRLGILDDEMIENKESWKYHSALLPIPMVEIESNSFLTQNPGY